MRTLGYLARVECQQVKYYQGDVAVEDGTVVTLALSDGYPSCSTGKEGTLFSSAAEARSSAKKWDGMPWMFRFKPGTLRLFEVVEVEPARAAVIEEREVTT